MTSIRPRSSWTPTTNTRTAALSSARVTRFVVHYPATPGTIGAESAEKIAARLRGWRDYHINGHGWRDIGYNYAVDQAGRVWDLSGDHVGAHANAVGNVEGLGVLCIVGNTEQPSAEMVAALQWLYATKRKTFPRMTTVQGHQQVPGNSTECPGGPLMTLVRSGLISSGAPSAATPERTWFDMATLNDLVKAVETALNDNAKVGEVHGALRKGIEGKRPAGDLRVAIEKTDARTIKIVRLQEAVESSDPAAIAEALRLEVGDALAGQIVSALGDRLKGGA